MAKHGTRGSEHWRCLLQDGLQQTDSSYDQTWGIGLRAELNGRTQNGVKGRHNGGTQGATQARQRKLNLKRAMNFHRSKIGFGSKYYLHWGEGGLDTMQILSKKGFTQYRYESPPGVHNKYYEALSREIKTVCSNGPKHNLYNCGTFWSALE